MRRLARRRCAPIDGAGPGAARGIPEGSARAASPDFVPPMSETFARARQSFDRRLAGDPSSLLDDDEEIDRCAEANVDPLRAGSYGRPRPPFRPSSWLGGLRSRAGIYRCAARRAGRIVLPDSPIAQLVTLGRRRHAATWSRLRRSGEFRELIRRCQGQGCLAYQHAVHFDCVPCPALRADSGVRPRPGNAEKTKWTVCRAGTVSGWLASVDHAPAQPIGSVCQRRSAQRAGLIVAP